MSERTQPGEAVDLTNCDREPIHELGSILPYGVLLALDPDSLEVLQVAGATADLLGREADDLLARGLGGTFRPDQLHRLRGVAMQEGLDKPRHLLDPAMRVGDRPLDASVHRNEAGLIVELEPADLDHPHAADPLACVQDMLAGLDRAPDLQAFCQTAAERVRDVTEFDRVMVYRFLEDGAGLVMAEARDESMVPFLDLRYPASDIPRQARALYLRSWIRAIERVDYEPAPLRPALSPRTGAPLDMSMATLRGVSPIHREYLRNMGVDASMSISIVRDGKLWGLVVCHHRTPRRLPRHLRAICELFGVMLSLQLQSREQADLFEARLASGETLRIILQDLAAHDDYGAGLIEQAARLLAYLDADGLAVQTPQRTGVSINVGQGIYSVGLTPDDAQVAALTAWLSEHIELGNGVFATDRLAELWPPARAYTDVGAGLLAISVSREPRDYVLWFRPEVVETVRWGGDPTKPVELGPNGDRLTPRKSFEAWAETVRGRSQSWSEADVAAAADLRVSLIEVVLRRLDEAARERDRTDRRQELLMAELDHRVKNTLATIQALVSSTARSAGSLGEFTQGLGQRIAALSRAHSLLTHSRWEGTSIADLVAEELGPFQRDGRYVAADGTDAVLAPKAALALALALHELATNAAKYGALSVGGGRVEVRWDLTAAGGLRLAWRESGGPLVRPPQRRGFGSTLIERALAMEVGGSSRLVFEPEGVTCEVLMPAAAIVRSRLATSVAGRGARDPEAGPRAVHGALPARSVLVVEDSSLVILLYEQMIEEMGWTMVGPATRVSEALALAQREEFDVALLDVNLDGEMSWGVADLLAARGIPYIFTTGYDGATVLPPHMTQAPVVGKPAAPDVLKARLRALVGRQAEE